MTYTQHLVDSWRVLATGLEFPEGPVAFEGGSTLVAEVGGPRITAHRRDRLSADSGELAKTHYGRAERSCDRAGRGRLCVQQRRLRLVQAG